MKKWLMKLLPFFFFISIVCLLFYKVIFLGQVFYEGDNFHLNIPAKYFLVQQITHGIFPLWNPYLFLGIPYFADLNVGTLFPLNILYFLFSVPQALSLTAAVDIFLLTSFQYIFLRQLKLSKIVSVFGAGVFAFGGMPFILINNITYLNTTIFIPLIFLFSYLLIKTKKIYWLFLLILVQAIQLLSGHPQPTYYTIVFISLYLLLFSNVPGKKRILIWVAYIFTPLLLSSFQLIPFIEYTLHATRQIHDIAYANGSSLSFSSLPVFIFPLLYGNHVDGNWWGPQTMLVGYVGIPTLILAIVGINKVKFQFKKFTVISLLLSFLLAFGKLTPLFFVFFFLIPGWQLFRNPSSLIIFYTFFMSILASFGLNFLAREKIEFNLLIKILSVITFFTSFVTVILLIKTRNMSSWESVLLFVNGKFHNHALNYLLTYSPEKIHAIFSNALWNIVFVSTILLICLFILGFVKRKIVIVICFVILTFISLLVPDTKIITTTSETLYKTNFPISKTLSDVTSGHYRLLAIPINLHQNKKDLPGSNYFLTEANANLHIYKDDNNMENALYVAEGYTALVPKSYALYLQNNLSEDITGVDISHITKDQLNQTSVKYIISREKLINNQCNNIPLKLISSSSNQYIYENSTVLPRVYLLSKGFIINTLFQANRIDLKVNTDETTQLIITNWFYPGWKAMVNGKETSLKSYKNTFQQISLPKGMSTIEIIYDPVSLKIGITVSIITGVGFIGMFLLFKKKKYTL